MGATHISFGSGIKQHVAFNFLQLQLICQLNCSISMLFGLLCDPILQNTIDLFHWLPINFKNAGHAIVLCPYMLQNTSFGNF